MEVGEGRFPAVIVTGNQAASGNVPDHVLGDECGQSTGVAVVEGAIASPHDLDVGGFGHRFSSCPGRCRRSFGRATSVRPRGCTWRYRWVTGHSDAPGVVSG